MYKKLIEFHKAGNLSFKYVKTFNMDEYVGEFYLLPVTLFRSFPNSFVCLSLLPRAFCPFLLLYRSSADFKTMVRVQGIPDV